MLQVAVLEDEQESRMQIKRCLERYQAENHAEWNVDFFSSGAEFLFSGASDYDMLLMDIEMPKMNGMEVARRVRREDQHVAIVFITNMANYALQGRGHLHDWDMKKQAAGLELNWEDFRFSNGIDAIFQFIWNKITHGGKMPWHMKHTMQPEIRFLTL